jgi:hypothetical protein
MHGHTDDTGQSNLTRALQSPPKYILSAGVENVSHRNGDVYTAKIVSVIPTNTRVKHRTERNRNLETYHGKETLSPARLCASSPTPTI